MQATLSEQGIHADRDGLHVVDPDQMQKSAALQQESKEFLGKTKQFQELVADFIQVMESRSQVIESEKLKAIGQRNRVESEQENRVRQKRLLMALLAEKEAELQRYDAQYESLRKVDQDQRTMIEKLSNNEA